MPTPYKPEPHTIEAIVDEKMKILEEFYVVDKNNYDSIRADILAELRKVDSQRYEYAADRIARRYITEKLARV